MPVWGWIIVGVAVPVAVIVWLLRLMWGNRPPDLAGMDWPWSK